MKANAMKSAFAVKARSGSSIREAPKKKAVVNTLIIIILAYSAIKIRAKPPLLYSILNPETNSDSPSAKSNGVRLVSAKVVVNHVINKGRTIHRGQVDW